MYTVQQRKAIYLKAAKDMHGSTQRGGTYYAEIALDDATGDWCNVHKYHTVYPEMALFLESDTSLSLEGDLNEDGLSMLLISAALCDDEDFQKSLTNS